MEPHMIENYIHFVLTFEINHVGFILLFIKWFIVFISPISGNTVL